MHRRFILLASVLACGPTAPMNPDPDTSTTDTTNLTTTTSTSSTSTTTTTTTSPASTSTTAVDPTTTSPTDDSQTFIIIDDFVCLTRGARCSMIECDTWAQDCPDGDKCTPYADDGGSSYNNKKCVPVDRDPDHPGEPCTVEALSSGVDSCDQGSMCWDVDAGTLTGTCAPFCTGSPDDPICPPDRTCLQANDGVLAICLSACDPLAIACPPTDVCVANPGADDFICVIDASADEGQPFDPCEFINACDPGLACVNSSAASECDPLAAGCCSPYCDITLPPNCPGAMQTCLPWFDPGTAPPEHANVGFCSLPQ